MCYVAIPIAVERLIEGKDMEQASSRVAVRGRTRRYLRALVEAAEPRILFSFVINPTGNEAYAHAVADGPTGGYVYGNPAHMQDAHSPTGSITSSATAAANATYQATANQIVVHADATETKTNDGSGNSLADSSVQLPFTMTAAGTISISGTLAGTGDGNLSQIGVTGSGAYLYETSDAPHALPATLNLPAGTYTIVAEASVDGNSVDGSIVNSNANSSADLTITLGAAATKPPHITSANAVTFQIGEPSAFMVTTTGDPTPGITETAFLPDGITFVDNGNGTATLSGTPSALDATGHYDLIFTASNGVAIDATHPAASQFFTLTLSGAGIKLPLPATHLVFAPQPATTNAGATLAPVTVLVEDRLGHVVTTDDSTVSLTLAGTAGGVLNGTAAVQAVNGVATFSDVSLTKAGTYTLAATDSPLRPARSRFFRINPDGNSAHLVLSTSLAGTVAAGKPLTPIRATLEDQFGNIIKNNRTTVTLSLAIAPVNGTVKGRTTVPFIGGVATFRYLRFSPAGSYSVELTDSTLPGTGSAPLSLTINVT
jgi:hypothetical protein